MTAKRATPKKKATVSPHSPSEIATGVFVGSWNDAVSFRGKRYCVLDELPADAPADEGLTIYDEARAAPIRANLDRLAGLIDRARKNGDPVLVFCGHGIRRSPLGGAWYLHRSEGISLEEAYARIRAVRPKVEEAKDWIEHTEALSEPSAARGGGREPLR